MPSTSRHLIQILLGFLLAVALGVVGRADQFAVSGSADGNPQYRPEMPFLMSVPALEIKTGARKEGFFWKTVLSWTIQRHPANAPMVLCASILGHDSSHAILCDLESSRGRGPPCRPVS